MEVSRSDTVQFNVGGTIFAVAVPNLRLSHFHNSILSQAVVQARDNDDDSPVNIAGDPALFPYILDLHRNCGKIRIPAFVSKEAVIDEARTLGLPVSAESIIQEGDAFRDGVLRDGGSTLMADYFAAWTVDQVADWLKQVQQGRFALHADTLSTQNIDGPSLATLTQEKMAALGVSDPKTRRALLAAIEAEATAAQAEALDIQPGESKFKEYNNEEDDDDEESAAKKLDAAALVLRTILGESGTPELFTDMITQWRADNKPFGFDGKPVGEVTALGDGASKRSTHGVLVATRVRPVLEKGPDQSALDVGDFECISKAKDPGGLVVHACGVQRDGKTPKVDNKEFRTHIALDKTCDEERVFDVVSPLVDTAVKDSLHASILCYGQTGSGKTHTAGHIACHLARYLYDYHNANTVVLEAFELKGGAKGLVSSNSNVFSLNADHKPELTLFEGEDGAVRVGGSNSVFAGREQPLNLMNASVSSSPEELETLFRQAESRRASRDTARNAASSRSHAFYRFYLGNMLQQDLPDNSKDIKAAFKQVFDRHDGLISTEQLAQFLKNLGHRQNCACRWGDIELDVMFKSMHVNADGKVRYEEFVDWIMHEQGHHSTSPCPQLNLCNLSGQDGTVFCTGTCVELVDLAGSESNKDSLYHNKTRIDERAKINSSLVALNTCIQKTIQGAAYVPFRADKLTQILRPCFARRGAALATSPTVAFLACLSPLASDTQQSIRTLTYTQELAGLKGKAQRTTQQKKFMGPGLKRLAAAAEKGDIDELRAAISAAQRDGITGPERSRALKALQVLEEQALREEAANSTS